MVLNSEIINRRTNTLSVFGFSLSLLTITDLFWNSLTESCCHLCVSGEQAEAGPGLYEAGAAVQRTRLWDPQRVSDASRHSHWCMFLVIRMFSHINTWKHSSLSYLHLGSLPKGTLTGVFVDSWFLDLILRLYASTSPPNLIWRAKQDSQNLTWIASVWLTFTQSLKFHLLPAKYLRVGAETLLREF